MKKYIHPIYLCILLLGLSGCEAGVSQEMYDAVLLERDQAVSEANSLREQLNELEARMQQDPPASSAADEETPASSVSDSVSDTVQATPTGQRVVFGDISVLIPEDWLQIGENTYSYEQLSLMDWSEPWNDGLDDAFLSAHLAGFKAGLENSGETTITSERAVTFNGLSFFEIRGLSGKEEEKIFYFHFSQTERACFFFTVRHGLLTPSLEAQVLSVMDTAELVGAAQGQTEETDPAAAPAEESGVITKAAYDLIENGMTYEQVVSIVGSKGNLVGETDGGFGEEYRTEIYMWYGNHLGSNANIMFQGGQVISKTQTGLE